MGTPCVPPHYANARFLPRTRTRARGFLAFKPLRASESTNIIYASPPRRGRSATLDAPLGARSPEANQEIVVGCMRLQGAPSRLPHPGAFGRG
jgi:hypothetical protein